ncbi:hypothetical protein [Nostoc sp.]|uniref:hypothetical protein n=1 Tax=Nostoc sp. TaxID=1180 RepID=UPI002FF1E0FB
MAEALTRISHKLQAFDRAEGQRGRGAEGKELGIFVLSPAPLLPCSPAQARALRGVVRNPGLILFVP